MHVRRYRAGEEPAIWQLYHDTTHLIVGQAYTRAQVERWAPEQVDAGWEERLRQKNPFVAVVEGSGIVGFGELEPDGHIDRFYCHHLWQRRGVGKQLYRAIETEARRLGIRLLFAEVSVMARTFFLGRGFEIVEERDNLVCGAIAKQFLMQKRLVPESAPE